MTLREDKGRLKWTLLQLLACNGCKYEGECDAFPTWGVVAGFTTCGDNLKREEKHLALVCKGVEGIVNPYRCGVYARTREVENESIFNEGIEAVLELLGEEEK